MEQGADFSAQIELQSYVGVDYDLSTAVITAQMRKSWMSTYAYDFDCFINDPVNGTFIISMGWEQTSLIDSGRYLYDIYITDPTTNNRLRVIEGTVFVNPGITRV